MWHRGQQNGGQVEQALHGRLGEAGLRGQGEAPGSMVKIIVKIADISFIGPSSLSVALQPWLRGKMTAFHI